MPLLVGVWHLSRFRCAPARRGVAPQSISSLVMWWPHGIGVNHPTPAEKLGNAGKLGKSRKKRKNPEKPGKNPDFETGYGGKGEPGGKSTPGEEFYLLLAQIAPRYI